MKSGVRRISLGSMISCIFNIGKVKVSLCLTKHHVMKTYWRSGGIAPRIL
jgi:hypothetical protein